MAKRIIKGKQANGGPAPNGTVEKARYKEKLPCVLTDEEAKTRAHTMAETVRLRDEQIAKKAVAMAGFRDIIKAHEVQIAKLAQIVETGEEKREVVCVDYLIHRTNEIQTVRLDTGETLGSRTARPDELQEALPLAKEPDDDGFDEESEDDILTSAQADALAEERP